MNRRGFLEGSSTALVATAGTLPFFAAARPVPAAVPPGTTRLRVEDRSYDPLASPAEFKR